MEGGVHGEAGQPVQKPVVEGRQLEPGLATTQHPNTVERNALQTDQGTLKQKLAMPMLVPVYIS